MPQSKDLHGRAPDKSNVSLVLIDVIGELTLNYFERILKVDMRASTEINFAELAQTA